VDEAVFLKLDQPTAGASTNQQRGVSGFAIIETGRVAYGLWLASETFDDRVKRRLNLYIGVSIADLSPRLYGVVTRASPTARPAPPQPLVARRDSGRWDLVNATRPIRCWADTDPGALHAILGPRNGAANRAAARRLSAGASTAVARAAPAAPDTTGEVPAAERCCR
jgi:hypothetical protein